jgi:plasmid stabilization system protein ParE
MAKARRHRKPTAKAVKVDQSWIAILDDFGAGGGISYIREYDDPERVGPGEKQDYRGQKVIDHKKLVAEGSQIKDAARYVLRAHATKTRVLGWVATANAAKVIDVKLAELQEKAADFNERSAHAGCECRVYVEWTPLPFEINQPSVARQLGRTVRTVCQDLLDTIRAGDVNGLDKVFLRTKNLGELAPSFFLEDSITFMVECAKRHRTTLKAAAQETGIKLPPKKSPKYKAANKKLKAKLRPIAAKLDLDDIENCIGNWTDRAAQKAADAVVEAA